MAVPAGGLKLSLTPGASEVAIHATELLANNTLKTPAVESSNEVSGAIALNADGQPTSDSKLILQLAGLKSDRSQRDNFIKRNTLDVAKYPEVEFVPTQVQGLDGLPPASGQKSFKMMGNVTIHGVTKPIAWDVKAQFDQQGAKGQATSAFKLTDFGMTTPKVGPVLAVDDSMQINLTFQAVRSA